MSEIHKDQEAFKEGYEAGVKAGITIGMSRNFERSKELTEDEYKEVINFLMARGLELCCYDSYKGGFSVRKRIIFNNEDYRTPNLLEK